jgi:hypothetical protein
MLIRRPLGYTWNLAMSLRHSEKRKFENFDPLMGWDHYAARWVPSTEDHPSPPSPPPSRPAGRGIFSSSPLALRSTRAILLSCYRLARVEAEST